MPRDKKTIHRATSDVEDEDISSGEEEEEIEKENVVDDSNLTNKDLTITPNNGSVDQAFTEERNKLLKDTILKCNLALKKQREREGQHKVSSSQK